MNIYDREIRTLSLILAIDIAITATELWGGHSSSSFLLWQNFYMGAFDALLIATNIWGLKQEGLNRTHRGETIANATDVLVGLGMCYIAYTAFASLTGAGPILVETKLIPWIGGIAAIGNALCALAVDPVTTNLASARFKLWVGSGVGLGTLVIGLLILWTDIPGIDPGITIIVAGVIIWAVYTRLKHQRETHKTLKTITRASSR